jgi:tRNA uracil 4-sulfurtransferase
LSHLVAADRAASLPVLRLLLAFGKLEIMHEIRRLGTADISALPDEDCCQLFRPRRVATHTTVDRLARIEARAGFDAMIDDVLNHLDPDPPPGPPDSMAYPGVQGPSMPWDDRNGQ